MRFIRCGDKGAELIAQHIADGHLPSLYWLDLGKNTIGAKGMRALASALGRQGRVTRLDMDNNPFGDDGAEAIASLAQPCPFLQRLSLVSCNIGPRGTKAICAQFASFVRLAYLDLSMNVLGVEGARALGEGLGGARRLETLLLGHNQLLGPGGEAIAPGVSHAPALARLALGDNAMRAQGVTAILDAARATHSLRVLDVSRNDLQPRGCRVVAELLGGCAALQEIDLSTNGCDDEAIDEVSAAVATSRFTALRFGGGGGDFAHNQGGEIRSAGATMLFDRITQAGVGRALDTLVLPSQGIRDDAVPAICAWIASGMARELSLEANKLTASGGAILIQAALQCPGRHLFVLSLSKNTLARLALGSAGGDRMRSLALDGCSLSAGDVANLAGALHACINLRLVDLRSNSGAASSREQWARHTVLKL